jgi:hypothetical protein
VLALLHDESGETLRFASEVVGFPRHWPNSRGGYQ